jgi:hypothetical protein
LNVQAPPDGHVALNYRIVTLRRREVPCGRADVPVLRCHSARAGGLVAVVGVVVALGAGAPRRPRFRYG